MACLRLKRYLSQNSSDAIIVSFKRQKLSTESTDDDEVETVLTLAGTVKSKDECVTEHLTKADGTSTSLPVHQPGAHRQFKSRPVNVKAKAKRDLNLASKANRYKIVCSARGVPDDISPVGEEPGQTTETTDAEQCRVYDLELEGPECHDESTMPNSSQGQSDTSEMESATPLKEGAYVYDLYYLQDLAGVDLTQKLINVQQYTPNSQILVGQNSSDDSDNADDDDDSNDEANFRNDYPDEDDDDDYEKVFDYGAAEFCDDNAIEKGFGAFNIDDDSYCYGEDQSESDCEGPSVRQPRQPVGKMSLRAQIAQIVTGDDIFSNAKYGNDFQ